MIFNSKTPLHFVTLLEVFWYIICHRINQILNSIWNLLTFESKYEIFCLDVGILYNRWRIPFSCWSVNVAKIKIWIQKDSKAFIGSRQQFRGFRIILSYNLNENLNKWLHFKIENVTHQITNREEVWPGTFFWVEALVGQSGHWMSKSFKQVLRK